MASGDAMTAETTGATTVAIDARTGATDADGGKTPVPTAVFLDLTADHRAPRRLPQCGPGPLKHGTVDDLRCRGALPRVVVYLIARLHKEGAHPAATARPQNQPTGQ
jgi:hypothetical protein